MGLLSRIDAAVYKVERQVVAWSMIGMGLVVALDVVHRVTTRQNGFVERTVRALLPDGAADAAPYAATTLIALFGVGAFYAVFRTRGVGPKGRALVYGVLATGVFWGLLELYVYLVPNGLIWSQMLGLALMIWAGFVGASLAARERRHLSLEIGPRLFPEKVRRQVVAVGHLCTAAFCVFLLCLAAWSVTQHFGDWTESQYEGGTFPVLPIPKWIAYLAIPYGLAVMALRVLGDAAAAMRGQETGMDEVGAFKKMGGVEDAGPKP